MKLTQPRLILQSFEIKASLEKYCYCQMFCLKHEKSESLAKSPEVSGFLKREDY